MSVWIARYALRPRRRVSARAGSGERHGALIRAGEGYGDVHPWPELGDAPLDDHLQSIVDRTPTPRARRALDCAAIDAEARSAGYSLFDDLRIPPSHFLALPGEPLDPEPIGAAGFERIKVKLGADAWQEARLLRQISRPLLRTSLRLRLDFNGSLGLSDLHGFLEALPPRLLDRIEFLEDPVPPDPPAWTEIRKRWGIWIAADREKPDPSCWNVAVIKPASEGDEMMSGAIAAGKPVVFTSAMDHPFGQTWAAFKAATANQAHPGRLLACGLLSHQVFEPTPFSERLRTDGPMLVPPAGTGLGFDDLLEGLPWTRFG